ncbi:MAG: hemerythrin domain-containing protein [Rhodospirillaceae bacterium]
MPAIEELERQHAAGEKLLGVLAERLRAAEDDFPAGMKALREALNTYVALQKSHIALEETEILPRARKCIPDADWRAIDRAFGADQDPLFGANLETGFRALHARIVGK